MNALNAAGVGSDEQGLDDDDQQPDLKKPDGNLMFVFAHSKQFNLPPHTRFVGDVTIDGNRFRTGPYNSQEEAQSSVLSWMAISHPQMLKELRKSQRLNPHLLLSRQNATGYKGVSKATGGNQGFRWICSKGHKGLEKGGYETAVSAAEAYLDHCMTEHNYCIEAPVLCVTAGQGDLTTI